MAVQISGGYENKPEDRGTEQIKCDNREGKNWRASKCLDVKKLLSVALKTTLERIKMQESATNQ